MRARRAWRPAARAVAGSRSAHADPERQRLLDHHHDARELLVGQRREPESRRPPRSAGRRREAEDQHVREHCPSASRRPKESRCGRRRRPRRAGSTSCVHDEQSRRRRTTGARGRARRVPSGVVVDAPGRARPIRERPERRGDERGAAGRESARAAAGRASGREERGRQEEDERAAHGGDEQRGPGSPISACWSMCAESRYSSPIESSGDTSGSDQQREAGREEQRAEPRRMIGPPPAQADERLREEQSARAAPTRAAGGVFQVANRWALGTGAVRLTKAVACDADHERSYRLSRCDR